MHWSSLTLASVLACGPQLSAAHGPDGDFPLPRLVGGRKFLSEVAASARLNAAANVAHNVAHHEARATATAPDAQKLNRRQGGLDGQCGPGIASCDAGYCCSSAGWCGSTSEYCAAPDCQINYGSGCDANQKPSGVDTSGVARPHVGSVLYGGVGIYNCVNQGDIAITFDDGPYNYTGDLLDKFASYGAKATFFITGNNLGKGMINDESKPWAGYIRRMIAEGHQVASHTWSHQNASELNETQYRDQIIWNEIAFNDILGYFPTYMRPPYSICGDTCQSVLSDLGYHIIYFDLDTEGYLHDSATEIQTSKNIWDNAINNANSSTSDFLMIEHDIHYQTVYNLTDYVLASLVSHGYKSVTVGECLGDPSSNWYRNVTSSGSTSTTTSALPTSTITSRQSSVTTTSSLPGSSQTVSEDATCGTGTTFTCQGSEFGNCCSQYGWCGSTTDYCGDGCQSGYGTCS